jgi:hypothetical protein
MDLVYIGITLAFFLLCGLSLGLFDSRETRGGRD